MNTCHDQTSHRSNYSITTPEATIFTSNATHGLTPESIVGPYFVAGELIRKNVTEDQAGIPVHLDLQFIDINTCEPIPNMLVDIWHANATGVYSGVVGSGGLNTSFLRGIQATNSEGVAQFDTIYPGHYLGRTNHIHIMSRRGGQILPNGTYNGGTVNHIGQFYFDQELTTLVEAMQPYRRNYLPLTTNTADFLVPQAATADSDPFLDYVMLSKDANDGLLMWTTVGINATADYSAAAWAAATWHPGGGVAATFPFPAAPKATGSGGTTGMSGAPAPSFGSEHIHIPPAAFPPIAGLPVPDLEAIKTPQSWGPCRAD
jgi:protocatechuate 3,4-dioxygenase beta subunit